MTSVQALVIPVGLDFFAVPMAAVREVVTIPGVCRVPTAPTTLLGLFNLRGDIVPVFDTAALVGLGRLPVWPFAAVVRTVLGAAGLAGSSLPESMMLGDRIGASDSHGATGMYAVGRRLVALLDVDALLTPLDIASHAVLGPGQTQRS